MRHLPTGNALLPEPDADLPSVGTFLSSQVLLWPLVHRLVLLLTGPRDDLHDALLRLLRWHQIPGAHCPRASSPRPTSLTLHVSACAQDLGSPWPKQCMLMEQIIVTAPTCIVFILLSFAFRAMQRSAKGRKGPGGGQSLPPLYASLNA